MYSAETWSTDNNNVISKKKQLLSNFSLYIRKKQYLDFFKIIKPKKTDSIIDIGVTPDETLVDSNFFEIIYPFKEKLVIASVEDCKFLLKKYKIKKFIKLDPEKNYPIKHKAYKHVVSWATLEHVGGYKKQKQFLKEIDRIGETAFLTTPYRYFFYELHTELFFLHYLPMRIFRKLLRLFGKNFWSKEENLNLLGYNDIVAMLPNSKWKVKIFYSLGFLPTHLIAYKK